MSLFKFLVIIGSFFLIGNAFAIDFSVENKTPGDIKADVYLQSNDPNIPDDFKTVMIASGHSAMVSLSVPNPKVSYTVASDALGHTCTLKRYRNIRVIQYQDHFVCLPR